MSEVFQWVDDVRQHTAKMVENGMPVDFALLIGLYVGVILGTLDQDRKLAEHIRHDLEIWLATGLGIPPEQLESHFRSLLVELREARGSS